MPPKSRAFWPLAFLLLFADCGSKQLVVDRLREGHPPLQVIGDGVRFALTYNPGAAFSLSLGDHSRLIFSVLAVIVIVVLIRMYRDAASADYALGAALGLVVGGAMGNLLDRLTSARGVVDFIDVGYGTYRFWTFNIADVGVTFGAVLLFALMIRRPAPEPTLQPTHHDSPSLDGSRGDSDLRSD